MNLTDRFRGSLLGLAVGDALGAPIEFERPGTFSPVTDMRGGGPFHLKSGQWTDDTSLALCLAESLIERRQFDPRDQLQRYVRWWREGHLSSTGRCFDIGTTTQTALERFETTGITATPLSQARDGNGSIMRLAPVPLFFAFHPAVAIEKAGESSRTTHGTRAAIDACRYLSGLIVGAIQGHSKETLLSSHFSPVTDLWKQQPLCEGVATIADGSFKVRQPPEIRGGGYVIDSLEAALWAFYRSSSFEEGALLAVNLGDDADTTAAVYGQLAGAYYGEAGIPKRWRAKIHASELIVKYAEALFSLAVEARRLP